MRSEAQKSLRKERDKILVKNYQDWYVSHLNNDKLCSKCGKNKKLCEFVSNYSHRNVCKECHKGKVHKWRNEIKNELNINYFNKFIDTYILNSFIISNTIADIAKSFLNKYHYAGYGRPASILFEARINEATIAIAKFTPVIRQEVATSLGLLPKDVLELDRLCVHPEYQVKNLVSKFLSKVIKELQTHSNAKYLVSFADTGQGHSGTVYRASNWREIGVSASSYYYIDKLGRRMNKKSLYNKAKSSEMSEKEYASQLGMEKVHTPGKFKFIYELKR